MKKDHHLDNSSARAMANPFGRTMWRPTTRLSPDELTQFREWVKANDAYKEFHSFFESCDPDLLINLAAAYYLPQSAELGIKIQEISGYTTKRIDLLAKRLQNIAEEIRRLNTVELPGAATFTQLIRELGISNVYLADMEDSFALADRFDSLPTVLLEYAEAVKKWPHPTYRKLLSERNWGSFRLAQLSLWIKAVTNDFHYKEIASLLDAVAQVAEERLNEEGRSEPFTPDLVGHNINNFRDRNPEVWIRSEGLATIAAERYREDRIAKTS